MKNHTLTLILFLLFLNLNLYGQTPAFPTAEGYGKYATGGRGGEVVAVTNLEDYIAYDNLEAPIPGSFRWALTQYPGEPLTIVFRVSGTIMLKPYLILTGSTVRNQNDIRCKRANLTIAGQTAPGEGIEIRNGKVNLGGCTNLIVRNVRFRIGELAQPTLIYGYKVDGIARDTVAPAGSFLPGGSLGCENADHVIFDHCVFGWSGEENITMYDNHFTTVQWCVMHEGLYDDGHGKGNRSYGGQCGGVNATWHHNLFAHNYSRSPRLNGARTNTEVMVFNEFINNVVYNWGRSGAAYGGEVFPGFLRSHTCNYVGNYFKPGPATDSKRVFFNINIVANANYPQWYVSGNKMFGMPELDADNWNGMAITWNRSGSLADIKSDTLLLPPQSIVYNGKWVGYAPYKINMQSAENAYQAVLNSVGTVNRDSVERRIIREVKTGTATFKASLGRWGIIDKSFDAEGYLPYAKATPPVDNDSDGMADDWEVANGLNPNDPSDRNLTTPEGYTALEVYLDGLMGENIDHDFFSGVKTAKETNISVYPTLTKGKLTVTADIPLKSAKIFDINGKQLLAFSLSGNSVLDISKLPKGCYFLKVLSSSGNSTHFKVIRD